MCATASAENSTLEIEYLRKGRSLRQHTTLPNSLSPHPNQDVGYLKHCKWNREGPRVEDPPEAKLPSPVHFYLLISQTKHNRAFLHDLSRGLSSRSLFTWNMYQPSRRPSTQQAQSLPRVSCNEPLIDTWSYCVTIHKSWLCLSWSQWRFKRAGTSTGVLLSR